MSLRYQRIPRRASFFLDFVFQCDKKLVLPIATGLIIVYPKVENYTAIFDNETEKIKVIDIENDVTSVFREKSVFDR